MQAVLVAFVDHPQALQRQVLVVVLDGVTFGQHQRRGVPGGHHRHVIAGESLHVRTDAGNQTVDQAGEAEHRAGLIGLQCKLNFCYRNFVRERLNVLVRFAMAYLQGVKEFNAAAGEPAKYPEIVDILARSTALQKPELVRAIAPNWSASNEDGIPNVKSVMAQQDYWSKYFTYVEKPVAEDKLFDLSIARDAKARLDKENPFAR